MKKIRNLKIFRLFSNRYFNYSLLILSGFLMGWLVFHNGKTNEQGQILQEVSGQGTIWTCAMHPQIRMHEPGDCPICGMDLIPLAQNGTASPDMDAVHLTKEAAALADVGTAVVTRQIPVKQIRLYGKIQADERMIQSQVSHISGRIEKLFVNFTGETVKKGQILAQVYSPELLTAQQELIEAAGSKTSQPEIYRAAREKLLQWKITDEQINAIENSGTISTLVDVVSNTDGIVISRLVSAGNYVSRGSAMFEVADLTKLWVMFDAFESDLRFLVKGESVTFTVEALPGEKFTGTIVFIDPVIDPVTRVARVRIDAKNSSGRLKPEMFVTGLVSAKLTEYNSNSVIPKSAVLWTGKRSLVYVRQAGTDEPVFKMREVELGPVAGDSYIVTGGLSEGEEIVINGAFSVDAAAQLAGKPSMMNPIRGLPAPGHDHSNMNSSVTGSTAGLQHEEFRVEGNCEMCKDRIESAVKAINGVESAVWNIETKKLHISFDNKKTGLAVIRKTIADAGHDNGEFLASDAVYEKLPECCLYRK